MVFSSLNFLLIFLPIVLLLHSVLPFKYKNIVLLAASIIFYAWGEPVYVILMILSIGFNYMSGLVHGELEDPHLRKRQLIFAVAVNLLLLGFFKYAGFLVSMINAILPLKIEFRSLALPVGISFYTFQALSYVIDVYSSSNGGSPYVVKQIEPEIEGVLVAAQGGGDETVVNEITYAVQVLFDVPVHKIKVVKMSSR